MAIRKILAAGMLALTMVFASAVVPAPAEAKTKIVVGVGGGYGYYGGYYGNCLNARHNNHCVYNRHRHHKYNGHINIYPRPIYYYDAYPRRIGKLSCGSAKDILRGNGYRNIVTRDCQGTTYSFKARKNGHVYILRLSARSGRITGVSRL